MTALLVLALASACPAVVPALPRPEFLDGTRPFQVYAPGSDRKVEMSWPDRLGPIPLVAPAGFPLVLAQDGRTQFVEGAPEGVNGLVDGRVLEAWFRGLDLKAGPVAGRPPLAEMAAVLLLATLALVLLRRLARPRLEAAAILACLLALLLVPAPSEELVLRTGDGACRLQAGRPPAGDAASLATPAGLLHLQAATGQRQPRLEVPCDNPPAWVRTVLGSPRPPLFMERGAWSRSYIADLDAAGKPAGR